jgi:hypothetical protein
MKNPNYYTKITEIDNGEGYWGYNKVEVFDLSDRKLGEYIRNYSSFAEETFYPFSQGDQDYALVSDKYTRTKVLALPSFETIAEEPEESHGFCPVDYYVPSMLDLYKDLNIDPIKEEHEYDRKYYTQEAYLDGQFGFVAGCVWGDDHSWKIQYLDLSNLKEGKFKRDDRFGYIELPSSMELREAIDLQEYSNEFGIIEISCKKTFYLKENK